MEGVQGMIDAEGSPAASSDSSCRSSGGYCGKGIYRAELSWWLQQHHIWLSTVLINITCVLTHTDAFTAAAKATAVKAFTGSCLGGCSSGFCDVVGITGRLGDFASAWSATARSTAVHWCLARLIV